MGKSVLYLSFAAITFLFCASIIIPASSVMWLASTSFGAELLRLGMMGTLAALIITDPPRSIYLRTIVGFMAIGLAYWAIGATYQNNMRFLDTMAILQFSISAGIVALERGEEELLHLDKVSKKSTKKPKSAAA